MIWISNFHINSGQFFLNLTSLHFQITWVFNFKSPVFFYRFIVGNFCHRFVRSISYTHSIKYILYIYIYRYTQQHIIYLYLFWLESKYSFPLSQMGNRCDWNGPKHRKKPGLNFGSGWTLRCCDLLLNICLAAIDPCHVNACAKHGHPFPQIDGTGKMS